MSAFDHDQDRRSDTSGINRRKVLECMTWAGTGVLWTIAGGVPRSLGLVGSARAAEPAALTFLQISDSHVGFDKPANPNALGTLEEAINRIRSIPVKPSFMIHTGDISHLSKAAEFDDADRIISQARLDVHYVPGEHDFLDEEVKLYRERYGRGARGSGWYSFDANGVHFIGLVNVVNLKAGGLGTLGVEQLEWLEKDVKHLKSSTPIVVFAHIPLWSVYPAWGWGTDDSARALWYLKRFGSVSVLNGHIHQVMHKVEGHVSFHTAMSTAFPQPAPGSAPSPGPMKVEADRLKKVLGIARLSFHDVNHPIAITDLPLEESAPMSSGAHEVVVDNFSFSPTTASVAAGTTVTWTNRDDVPHNIVSTTRRFKSPVLDTDERFSHAFDTPGTYEYFCSIHPRMTGRVEVA
jgi:plastocyanin